jgi:hypothetical protein
VTKGERITLTYWMVGPKFQWVKNYFHLKVLYMVLI